MCAAVIAGLRPAVIIPLQEAVLHGNLAVPCSAWLIFPQDSPSGELCRHFVLGGVGTPWAVHNHPGHCALGHSSLHSFAFPPTHLGRCYFWKRIVGNGVQEQSHGLAAALVLKNRSEKMLPGHLASLTEVRRYCGMLALNLPSSILKPASLSSFLSLDVILERSERIKKPLQISKFNMLHKFNLWWRIH